jgi:hypothetical protein
VRGHADAETLAAFRAELLSRRKAARVSGHLAACPRCAALDAQLAGVTALLSRTAAPPMPDALTARIEAALAAEAAARPAAGGAAAPAAATPGGAGHNGTRGTGGRRAGGPARDRSRLALRVAAVTAAVAVIAGGGYGVSRLLSGNPPSATGAAGSAPAARSSGAVPPMSGGSQPAAGAFAAPGKAPAPPLVVTSGTDYQPGRLAAQASAVLAEFGPNVHASARPTPTVAAPQNRSTSLYPDLSACVAHVAAGRHPLLVDVAKYQGHLALIVVLPAVNGGRPQARVIAPGCTATTAHVLDTATLPRSG